MINAMKRKDYDMYIYCFKTVPDLFFAFDMQNYARFMTHCAFFLENIEETHAGVTPYLRGVAISMARLLVPSIRLIDFSARRKCR